MRSSFRIRPFTVASLLASTSCFAIVDVDRFQQSAAPQQHPDASAPDALATPGKVDEYLNLSLSLVGMSPHVAELFEYRVIDAHNFIQSRGMVNPLGAPNVTIHVPMGIPKANGPFHLDFYADHNKSGGYDGRGDINTDHAWRIDPLEDYPQGFATPIDGLVQVTFTHNTSFTEINQYPGTMGPPSDTGLGATIQVVNADALHGVLMQARVVATGGHTIGLFRIPAIAQAAFDMTIPGVVESLGSYDVFVYADKNGNGTYDNPANGSGDLGWKLTGIADATGLVVRLESQTTGAANVDVGAP